MELRIPPRYQLGQLCGCWHCYKLEHAVGMGGADLWGRGRDLSVLNLLNRVPEDHPGGGVEGGWCLV